MSSEDSPIQNVVVKTTRPVIPFPPNEDREPIYTERLIIRPFAPEDLEDLRVLRTQPEVMQWTYRGCVDKDMGETRERLDDNLGERAVNKYNFVIALRSTGEFIGCGGSHNYVSCFGWPEIGYMLKKEYWGRGLATEFLKGFLGRWKTLPREEVEVEVDGRSVVRDEGGQVKEVMVGITEERNGGSNGVLEKNGFERFGTWAERETLLAGWRVVVGER
ncbi:GNAT N-acetyltransferase [Podospora aff. communis PSN243]|uniref:GNAT N-acetyltransferase n=1 Tax=Podospora aff. communis PSN243 TaxID=3040156 RepID=A0AAV9GTQ8_9PEZI|nr:GNAT N-acetyltransferase [Podospora aff. communis PSN243]